MGQCDHHILRGNQVFGLQLFGVVLNDRTANVAKFFTHRLELVHHNLSNAGGFGQDVEQVGNGLDNFPIFGNDLVLLQAGKSLQTHLENFLRLYIA